jgi:lipopolysaccharide/colanic/teichoic acid biosynthesis glycosyltransferase
MVYKKNIKRIIDVMLSLIGLIILAPVFLIITFAIFINMGGPIFFRQIRPGLNAKPFQIYKFRTMTNETDTSGNPLSNEERITKLGMFLRSTSLDEIPELINVLKGDMSLVGPRPLLFDYVPYFNQHQHRRHEALPGITGLAQVNGRNALTWEKRFDFDVQYVEQVSFMLDLKILFTTIVVVLKRQGIGDGNNVSCEPFRGTSSMNETNHKT